MPTRKPIGAEYRFRIDAYSPETMPMARLAQYMAELATILGEQASVHFRALKAGSTVVRLSVDREAAPKVRERAVAVRRQEAPPEALKAYRAVNRLLREDNATGALKEQKGVIIAFPGKQETPERYPTIRQHGTLDGVVVSVGGADDTVHIRLLSEGEEIAGCYTTNRLIAKELAKQFDEPVRLVGVGNWNRNDEGKWSLLRFKIEAFEILNPVTLTEALADLRSRPVQFSEGAYDELNTSRHGPENPKNGRH